jgi:hypothetical protein
MIFFFLGFINGCSEKCAVWDPESARQLDAEGIQKDGETDAEECCRLTIFRLIITIPNAKKWKNQCWHLETTVGTNLAVSSVDIEFDS